MHNKGKKQQVKIYASSLVKEDHNYENGKILVENKTVKVAISDGFIIVEQLQLPGKKAMDVKSLLNGYSFESSAYFEWISLFQTF